MESYEDYIKRLYGDTPIKNGDMIVFENGYSVIFVRNNKLPKTTATDMLTLDAITVNPCYIIPNELIVVNNKNGYFSTYEDEITYTNDTVCNYLMSKYNKSKFKLLHLFTRDDIINFIKTSSVAGPASVPIKAINVLKKVLYKYEKLSEYLSSINLYSIKFKTPINVKISNSSFVQTFYYLCELQEKDVILNKDFNPIYVVMHEDRSNTNNGYLVLASYVSYLSRGPNDITVVHAGNLNNLIDKEFNLMNEVTKICIDKKEECEESMSRLCAFKDENILKFKNGMTFIFLCAYSLPDYLKKSGYTEEQKYMHGMYNKIAAIFPNGQYALYEYDPEMTLSEYTKFAHNEYFKFLGKIVTWGEDDYNVSALYSSETIKDYLNSELTEFPDCLNKILLKSKISKYLYENNYFTYVYDKLVPKFVRLKYNIQNNEILEIPVRFTNIQVGDIIKVYNNNKPLSTTKNISLELIPETVNVRHRDLDDVVDMFLVKEICSNGNKILKPITLAEFFKELNNR